MSRPPIRRQSESSRKKFHALVGIELEGTSEREHGRALTCTHTESFSLLTMDASRACVSRLVSGRRQRPGAIFAALNSVSFLLLPSPIRAIQLQKDTGYVYVV